MYIIQSVFSGLQQLTNWGLQVNCLKMSWKTMQLSYCRHCSFWHISFDGGSGLLWESMQFPLNHSLPQSPSLLWAWLTLHFVSSDASFCLTLLGLLRISRLIFGHHYQILLALNRESKRECQGGSVRYPPSIFGTMKMNAFSRCSWQCSLNSVPSWHRLRSINPQSNQNPSRVGD